VFGKAQKLTRLHQGLGHVGYKRLLQIVMKGATLDVVKLAVSQEKLLKAACTMRHACRDAEPQLG
jgi:hypothetical protein